MSDNSETDTRRSLWVRVLQMILMALAFHVAITILGVLTAVQLVLAIIAGGPNARLQRFGRSLGKYLHQIAEFETFASEEVPFPFADWPQA